MTHRTYRPPNSVMLKALSSVSIMSKYRISKSVVENELDGTLLM